MVAMQIGLAMSLVIEPLNKALAPWLFEQLSKQDAATNRMVVKNTYRFYLVLGVIGLVVVGAAHLFFDYLIGPKFHEAKPLIVWMVLGVVFQGMYYSVVNYLFYAEKTGRLSVVSSLTAASATLVSYLMISKFGITGAAVSFAVNNCILFLLVWLVASKAVPMPWLLKGQANGSY
jgi:O-antigen/teichoic acid export membrane protein